MARERYEAVPWLVAVAVLMKEVAVAQQVVLVVVVMAQSLAVNLQLTEQPTQAVVVVAKRAVVQVNLAALVLSFFQYQLLNTQA